MTKAYRSPRSPDFIRTDTSFQAVGSTIANPWARCGNARLRGLDVSDEENLCNSSNSNHTRGMRNKPERAIILLYAE
ncbi:hypothetical protein V2G26_003462 [Clonostachys chloroleuca]